MYFVYELVDYVQSTKLTLVLLVEDRIGLIWSFSPVRDFYFD